MNPTTPSGNTNKFFGTKVSKPGVNVNNASDKQLVLKDDFTSRIYYDNNNSRIVLGQLPDGSYGLWVSQVGEDVTDPNAAIDNGLVFNSNQDIFKIVQTGTVTIPGAGPQSPEATGALGVTVPHNLGYPPSYSAYVFVPIVPVDGQPPVSAWNQSLPTFAADANGMAYNLQAGTDDTNIYFVDFWANNLNTASVQPFDVTYYLFTNSAN